MREIVFGIEDGIVSTAGAVIGIAAGTQNPHVVLLSGIVIVVVEALSMAAGSFLSSKSQRELLESKVEEERREIEAHPEKETEELRVMYRERGFTDEEIGMLVRRITADKKLWLEEMMAKELRIGAGEFDESSKGAAYMWVAYMLGGAVPIIPFALLTTGKAMLTAFFLSLIGLFALGAWKAKVTGNDPWKSGIEMLLVASAAGVMGYLVGRVLGPLIGAGPV